MYHFYIVKYNPLLKYRNWFKIWNKSHTKYIKIHLDPIENTLYCIAIPIEGFLFNIS